MTEEIGAAASCARICRRLNVCFIPRKYDLYIQRQITQKSSKARGLYPHSGSKTLSNTGCNSCISDYRHVPRMRAPRHQIILKEESLTILVSNVVRNNIATASVFWPVSQ